MTRTKRVIIDSGFFDDDGIGWTGREEFSYTQAELATVALDDHIVVQLPFVTYLGQSTPVTEITVWGLGIISIGPPTPAQVAFMLAWTAGSNVFDFPGDFISVNDSNQIASIIEIGTGFIDRSTNPESSGGGYVYDENDVRDRFTVTINSTTVEFDRSGFTIINGQGGPQVGYSLGGEIQNFLNRTYMSVDYSEELTSSAYLRNFYYVDSFSNLENIISSDLITGSAGNNILEPVGDYTFRDAQTIAGLEGNDQITGGAGNDVLIGGAGDDQIYGDINSPYSGDDNLHGGDGADLLWGGNGSDFLYGDAGNDVLYGGSGEDLLRGGEGDDLLEGGDDHDLLDGGTGNDLLFGEDGNDSLWGGDGADILVGGSGADILVGGLGADTLRGGPGIDALIGGFGNDVFQDYGSDFNLDSISFTTGDRIVFYDADIASFTFSLSGNVLTYAGLNMTAGTLYLYGVVGQLVATATDNGVQLMSINDVRNDFNGDGRSDILWRNVDGQMSNWLGQANGGLVQNNANAAAVVPTAWQIAGTGDFDGDGRDDILWRNVDGQMSNWLGTATGGFTPNNANAAAVVPLSWSVSGIGDFNGDGRDDILWRNVDGTVSNWLGSFNGGFYANDDVAARSVPIEWSVVGIGDFNGDGQDDILWRRTDGTISNWLGQADLGYFVLNDEIAMTSVATDWQVAGTGDFNGDGRDDILWRNTNGTLSNWLGQADGGFINNGTVSGTFVPLAWSIVAVGDYNGDGRDDILWRHTDGTLSNWLANPNGSFTPNDTNAATPVPTSWEVQPEAPLL